jgi:hypothetical protein
MQAMCDAILINSMAGWPGRALAVQCRWAGYQVLPRFAPLRRSPDQTAKPKYEAPAERTIRRGFFLPGERRQSAAFPSRLVASPPPSCRSYSAKPRRSGAEEIRGRRQIYDPSLLHGAAARKTLGACFRRRVTQALNREVAQSGSHSPVVASSMISLNASSVEERGLNAIP